MKTVFEHIEQLQGKPHHVRKRIAFATAAVGAIGIALVWFVGSISAGAFAIQGSSFAASTEQGGVIAAPNGASGNSNLAGAAAALSQDENAPAHIEIVNAPAAAPKKQAEQTTLPF